MKCEACGKGFEPGHPRARFCSPACRSRVWRKQRERAVKDALDTAERAIERARQALAGKGEP